MTMVPMITPSTTIISGSSRLIRLSTITFTSSSYTSAILYSIVSRSPVSSPTTVVQPATKVEKQREEELAPEQQQSAVRYVHGSGNTIPPGPTAAIVLAAALTGAGLRYRMRRRDRGEELALSYSRPPRRRL